MGCSTCDGQAIIIADEVARHIGHMLGPRRRDSKRINQHGGKAIVKWDPSPTEYQGGIRQQATVVDWQSKDGEPYPVTVEGEEIKVNLG